MVFIIAVISIATTVCGAAEMLPEPFKVIPQPQQVELLGRKGLGFGELRAIQLKGDFPRPVTGPLLSYLPATEQDDAGALSLQITTSSSVPDSKQGYVLVISDGKVEITSRGKAGLFYGCQTLQQLLEDARDTGTLIPACKITDFPALSYRAVHFDVKHHLDTMKYYYDSIDRLARYKINAIIFEFEDKLRYQRQPLVGAPQAISIDEMAALTDYARRRHIEISPLVQGLGHATFILKHNKYAHLRENPNEDLSWWTPRTWAFCPLHEGTYQVLFDLYRDAVKATPNSRYLHVGGDEIGHIGRCPRCKPTAEKEGTFGLNLYWLNRVCQFAAENGRIPIFWDDMPIKNAGLWLAVYYGVKDEEKREQLWKKGLPILNSMIEKLPDNCVFMRWNYGLANSPSNIRMLDWYRSHNLKAMIATAVQSGPTALLPRTETINNVQSFITIAADHGIDGMLCTAWDDGSLHMETYWRGLIASAEFSWSPKKRTLDDYELAYLQREFGPECTDAIGLYPRLRKSAAFWTEAFSPVKNRMHTEEIIDIPDINTPGKWSEKYKDRLDTAEDIAKQYPQIKKQLAQLLAKARRNRYHWQLFSAINDFQVTAPRLLLALKKCDVPDKSRQKTRMKSVRTALEEFNLAWENLKAVYARTRFIAYPENYVKDRYFHFASKREDLSFMIVVEQKYHELIKNWLKTNDT